MWQSKQKHWRFNLAQNFPRGHRSPLREKVFSLSWHFQIKFRKTSFFFLVFSLATSSILNSKTVSKWQAKRDKQSQVKIYLWYLRKCCDFVCFLRGTFEVICSAQGLLNVPADGPAESWKRGNLSSKEKVAFLYLFLHWVSWQEIIGSEYPVISVDTETFWCTVCR